MKSMFLKYMSALLAVWYCMSIIGFDVHACASTGDVFINSVLAGTTCEDIHPEQCCDSPEKSHSCSCCCGHDVPLGDTVGSDDDCCTNDIKVLDTEGMNVQKDDVYPSFAFCNADAFAYDVHVQSVMARVLEIQRLPDSGCMAQPDCQAVFNIWRI